MRKIFETLKKYNVEMDINHTSFVPNGYISVKLSKGDYRRAWLIRYDDNGECSSENVLVDIIVRFAEECDLGLR